MKRAGGGLLTPTNWPMPLSRAAYFSVSTPATTWLSQTANQSSVQPPWEDTLAALLEGSRLAMSRGQPSGLSPCKETSSFPITQRHERQCRGVAAAGFLSRPQPLAHDDGNLLTLTLFPEKLVHQPLDAGEDAAIGWRLETAASPAGALQPAPQTVRHDHKADGATPRLPAARWATSETAVAKRVRSGRPKP